MLELIYNRLADSGDFAQVEICESLQDILGVATALDDGSLVLVPWQEQAAQNRNATGGHRQRVACRFVVGVMLRRHDDPRGAERALAFDAYRQKVETLLAGWQPAAGSDACSLVGAETSGLGDGVSIYAQTWATSRFLTGANRP